MPTLDEAIASSRAMCDALGVASGYPPRTSEDYVEPVPPFECTHADIERWNAEWVRYLGREWRHQLLHYSMYPLNPEFPENAIDALQLRLSDTGPGKLSVYCDRSDLVDKRVMEMGCGCGNMGKLIARYPKHYLGVDYSTMALSVARLVSPLNCTYIHVADRESLQPFFGNVDTVISRHFWIHQNAKLARHNLDYLSNFLTPGGRLYMDFYWPDPNVKVGRVYSPYDPLSKAFPSCTFPYTLEDVEFLISGTRYSILREEIHIAMQRRYVILEAH